MEGSGFKYNYLIDEDQTIGKDGETAHGPNTVISILNHHFKNHGMGEKCAVEFLPLKGIRKFHLFSFSALLPGIVLCSVHADEKVPVV